MNMTRIKSWPLLLAVAGIAGCQNKPDTQPHEQITHGEHFYPETEKRDVNRFVEAQTATAARMDSTLYPFHFSGADLNSLGREKLEMMLKDGDAALPMTVYFDMPKDTPHLESREEAVAAYLKDAGLANEQFALKVGPNMSYGYPAALGLRAMANSDSAGAPSNGVSSSPNSVPVNPGH